MLRKVQIMLTYNLEIHTCTNSVILMEVHVQVDALVMPPGAESTPGHRHQRRQPRLADGCGDANVPECAGVTPEWMARHNALLGEE